jgi:hypothetical protein
MNATNATTSSENLGFIFKIMKICFKFTIIWGWQGVMMGVDWYQLILDAQMCRGISLSDEHIMYVCSVLDEYIKNTEAFGFFAYERLANFHDNNVVQLKIIGDCSVISAGFFPDRSERYGVSSNYYAALGEMSYQKLADVYHLSNHSHSEHYQGLADKVVEIVAVLETASRIGK